MIISSGTTSITQKKVMSDYTGRESVNPDLVKERAHVNFDVEQLTNFLDRGAETTKRRREIQQTALRAKVSMCITAMRGMTSSRYNDVFFVFIYLLKCHPGGWPANLTYEAHYITICTNIP